MAQRLGAIGRVIGLAAAVWGVAGAGALAQSQLLTAPVETAIPGSRVPLIATGHALEDPDKFQRFSQRTIARSQHREPEEFTPPTPNLAPPPPLTLSIAPIPLPDSRPPALFNKDFPSLRFPREQEYGVTGPGG